MPEGDIDSTLEYCAELIDDRVEEGMPEAEAVALYRDYYAAAPFVHVLDGYPDMKMVVNTNKCCLGVKKHGGKLHIVSVIDNLVKGASGQAVQNMNLVFGLPEDTGLHLKGTRF